MKKLKLFFGSLASKLNGKEKKSLLAVKIANLISEYYLIITDDYSEHTFQIGRLGIKNIKVKKSKNQLSIEIYLICPGLLIGKGGKNIEDLKTFISNETKSEVVINLFETDLILPFTISEMKKYN